MIILLFCACTSEPIQLDSSVTIFSTGDPIFYLFEGGPDMPIIGSTAPMIILYDNRQLFYYHYNSNKDSVELVYRELSVDTFESIKKRIMNFSPQQQNRNIVTDHGESTATTDLTETNIYFNSGYKEYIFNSYGLCIRDFNSDGFFQIPERPSMIGDESWEFYSHILSLVQYDGIPWTSDSRKFNL